MSQFDREYNKMVEIIDREGIWSTGTVRTKYLDGIPAHYKSYIGYQFRIDNSTDELCLITTRFAPTKDPIRELYWIWILQSNDVKVLNQLKCKYWDEWKQENGTIGKAYGYQIGRPILGYSNQLNYVIGELKTNPASRRIITETWVPEDLQDMALTPCVHLTQWSVVGDKLYLEVRQRSCDVALGLVANVYQYSILHKLVALECGLKPAEIIWNIHNMHIYDRHMEQILIQIKRPIFDGAVAKIHRFTSIYTFTPDDVLVENYRHGEKIFYEIAV
jgi:thymidylate synthase